MSVDGSSSNVGIGTSSPDASLHVTTNSSSGTFRLSPQDGTYEDYRLDIVAQASNDGALTMKLKDNTFLKTYGYYNLTGISYGVAGYEDLLHLKNSGNVGIGTTNPSVKLEIQTATSNTTSVEGLRLHNAGGGIGAGVKIGLGVGTTYSEKAYLRTDIINGGAGRLFIGVNGSDRVLIDNAGNVGIGTTSPDTTLHLATSASSTLTIQNTTNSGTASLKFRDEGDNDQYSVYYAMGANRAYNSVNGNGLTIYSSQVSAEIARFGNSSGGYQDSYFVGKVGIGTTSPSTKLDVNGITTSDAFRTDTSNTDYNVISRNSTSTTLWVQAAQSNSIQGIASFRYGSATVNAGTEVCAIRRNSSYFINTKLGVGTNNPAVTLDVEGTIKHKVYTVSALPSASPAGQRAFVSDSYYNLQQSHGSGVSGGGSNFCPVYSDGSNWYNG